MSSVILSTITIIEWKDRNLKDWEKMHWSDCSEKKTDRDFRFFLLRLGRPVLGIAPMTLIGTSNTFSGQRTVLDDDDTR